MGEFANSHTHRLRTQSRSDLQLSLNAYNYALQTVLYSVITYPMLKLEWTGVKFGYYALFQVCSYPGPDSHNCFARTSGRYTCSAFSHQMMLLTGASWRLGVGLEIIDVGTSQFLTLAYMTLYGIAAVALTPNEQVLSN